VTDPHSTTDDDNGDASVDDCYSDPNYWLERVQRVIAEVAAEYAFPGASQKHLITVDDLRAAGALDVPAEWRKSLGGEERRHLLPGFDDD
jgi:hypothetical protein